MAPKMLRRRNISMRKGTLVSLVLINSAITLALNLSGLMLDIAPNLQRSTSFSNQLSSTFEQ